jgi:hypothetical protein
MDEARPSASDQSALSDLAWHREGAYERFAVTGGVWQASLPVSQAGSSPPEPHGSCERSSALTTPTGQQAPRANCPPDGQDYESRARYLHGRDQDQPHRGPDHRCTRRCRADRQVRRRAKGSHDRRFRASTRLLMRRDLPGKVPVKASARRSLRVGLCGKCAAGSA